MPSQLSLGQISRVLAARLWQIVLSDVEADMNASRRRYSLGRRWEPVVIDIWVRKFGRYADEAPTGKTEFIHVFRPMFTEENYAITLGVIEWFVRSLNESWFEKAVASVLTSERCAYRMRDGSIVPYGSEEEGQNIADAANSLDHAGMTGAKRHLLNAGSLLTAGDFSGSVRESIHAVESTARKITGANSLKEALAELGKIHEMHPAFTKGLNALYGYTSDAGGIRHPVVDDAGFTVREADALFMFGACAAFIAFLVRVSGD